MRKQIDGKVIETKEDKIITKILHKLISEEVSKINRILRKIGTLNHQAEEYHRMFPEIQNEVRKEVFSAMLKNGWKDWINETKKDLEVAKSELNSNRGKEKC